MNTYLVSHYKFKDIKFITKQKSINEAIKYVAEYYGYSVLDLLAFEINELLKNNENILTIQLFKED